MNVIDLRGEVEGSLRLWKMRNVQPNALDVHIA